MDSQGSMSNEKILIVDDKPEVAEFCDEYLFRPQGYTPLIAYDGPEGLAMALREDPDLMILDFRLPRMSGLDVLRALREKQVDLPVIFTTAYGSQEDIAEAFRLGVKDYLTKPFDPAEMLSMVQRVLAEQREQEDQARRQGELERQVKKLSSLYGSSVQSVLNHIVESAVAISDAEEGYLLLLDEQSGELHMRSALNMGDVFASEFRVRVTDSVAGQVVESGEPVRLSQGDGEEGLKIKTGYLVSAVANVPLRANGRIIGVLGVDNRESSDPFAQSDLDLLVSLADHAAAAITNASVYEEIHRTLVRRVRELATMQQFAQDVNAVVDVRRIANIVLHHCVDITSAEGGLVGIETRGQVEWVAVGYLGTRPADVGWTCEWKEIVARVGEGRLGLATASTGNGSEPVSGSPRTRSHLAVPIRRGEKVLGVISLESFRPDAFAISDQQLVVALADRAGVAIENAYLFDAVVNEQRKTKLVLHSIADGVFTVDRELRITAFNTAAERIVGWRETEVIGKACAEVFCDTEGEQRQCELIQQAMDDGRSISSTPEDPPVLSRTGDPVYISSSTAPIHSHEGQVEGAVVVFRDVSSDRELDRLKSDFVSMISHELRSPLANLGAAIELLSNVSEGHEVMEKTLAIARANERRLARLIEDILNVSRIEAGQMRVSREPVTLAPLLKRVVRLAQLETGQHKIILRLPRRLPFVLADHGKVEIVANNLVTNAINYSPYGGRIMVKVEGPLDGELVVSVVDEGVGIPEEHLDKVFSRFYRVDTSDGRRVYGHGLGLYISKRLVELQGGRIWVQSRKGLGSCFSFSLPIVGGEEARARPL
jgi:PAS domain S-box-containing protein